MIESIEGADRFVLFNLRAAYKRATWDEEDFIRALKKRQEAQVGSLDAVFYRDFLEASKKRLKTLEEVTKLLEEQLEKRRGGS